MRNTLLYFIAIVGLAQASPLIRLAEAPIEIIGFWRLLLCALCFAPFGWHRDLWKRQNLSWAILSGVIFFAHLWTFFFATKNTSIANSMILYSINPLFTALGAFLFFKEPLPRRVIFAYFLAMVGIYQLVAHELHFSPEHFIGDGAALLSGVLLSGYVLTGNQARKTFSNSSFSLIIYTIVAVLFGLTAFLREQDFIHYPAMTWWAIAGLVIFPTILGHALFMYLLRHMNINLMSCGKLFEPPLAAVLAFWIFNEELQPRTLLAFALTSSAVLILFIPWQRLPWRRFWLEQD